MLKSNVFWMFCLALVIGACSGDNKGSGNADLPPKAVGNWSLHATPTSTNCTERNDEGQIVAMDISEEDSLDFDISIAQTADGKCEVHTYSSFAISADESPNPQGGANAQAVYKIAADSEVSEIDGDTISCKVSGNKIILTVKNIDDDEPCVNTATSQMTLEISEDGNSLTGSAELNGVFSGDCAELNLTQNSCGGKGSVTGSRIVEPPPVDENAVTCPEGQHMDADGVCVDGNAEAVTCNEGEKLDDATGLCACDTAGRFYGDAGNCIHLDEGKCLEDAQCDEGKVCDNLARARAAAVRQAAPGVATIKNRVAAAALGGYGAVLGVSSGAAAPTEYDCKAPEDIDHEAPTIKSCEMTHNRKALVLTFSEKVKPNRDFAFVVKRGVKTVLGTPSPSGRTVGFVADEPFKEGEEYTAGITGVEDEHGNALGTYNIKFQDAECKAVKARSVFPRKRFPAVQNILDAL